MPAQLGQTKETAVSELKRLSEVKETFKYLVSRISAYRLPTNIGLVTFSHQVKVEQQLTPILYDFQNRLDDIVPEGATALFDSLVTAKEMLDTFRSCNPAAKCRIIVLTDGLDNQSKFKPGDVCLKLHSSDIVLDAIVIGTNETQDLFKMAKHTGGYAFHPQTRDMLFQIFLLDGCLDIKSRPNIQKLEIGNYASSVPKAADMQTIYEFPPCRTQTYENDSFIPLQDARRHFTSMFKRLGSGSSVTTSTKSTDSGRYSRSTGTTLVAGAGGQGRILLNEIIAMINNPHPSMDVYASESNMGIWKVVMVGPSGSAYGNGTFVLFVELGDQFPMRAPSARFKTPVLHPNVTKVTEPPPRFWKHFTDNSAQHGRICHEIFSREWQTGIHVFEVLQHIWGIFFSLEVCSRKPYPQHLRLLLTSILTGEGRSGPSVHSEILDRPRRWSTRGRGICQSLELLTEKVFCRKVDPAQVKYFASQTRQQHRAEILGSSNIGSASSSAASTMSSGSNTAVKNPFGTPPTSTWSRCLPKRRKLGLLSPPLTQQKKQTGRGDY